MTVISEADLIALKANMERKSRSAEEDTPDPGPESVLMGKIMKFCKDNGFVYQ